MTYEDKVLLLHRIAKELRLKPFFNISDKNEGTLKEVKIEKKSKYANTVIKIVTMEEEIEERVSSVENYIIVELNLRQDINSSLYYKNIIEDIFKDKNIKYNVTLNIVGEKEGKLTSQEQITMINKILEEINAKKQEVFETEKIYSVYGYSRGIDNYILSNKKKVNIDIALSNYDKENKTKIYVASPLITVDY